MAKKKRTDKSEPSLANEAQDSPSDNVAGALSAGQITQLRRIVLRWFADHSRDLPWRKTSDRYKVWISEIMLQQTQVATVIDYWNRFISKYPTINELADAPQEEVLKLWEGLGYYRRARQLHLAAQQVRDQYAGQFPNQFKDVLALPGIGRYTAGAILSIADDQTLPILEGNTIRLYARLIGMETDPTQASNQKRLWEFAESIVPSQNAGAFNQGLMEIGGQICKPKNPSCLICPLNKVCNTYATGRQDQIPAPKAKKVQYENRHEYLVLLQKGQKLLCRQSQSGERWTGLWDFVRVDITDVLLLQEHLARWNSNEPQIRNQRLQWLEQQVTQLTGLSADLTFGQWNIRHGVTRFRIQLESVFGSNIRGKLSRGSDFVWLNKKQLQDLPFNVTARKFITQYSANLK